MENKNIKMMIIIAIVAGVIFVIGILALIMFISKPSNDDIDNSKNGSKIQLFENEIENKSENEDNKEGKNESSFDDSIKNTEKDAFNHMFSTYEGDFVEGEKVNQLLDIIRKNNEQNVDKQVKAMANVQKWDTENNRADTNSKYKISFEVDENEYIKIVKIEDAE